MNVAPVNRNNVTFGIKISTNVQLTSPISKREVNVIRFQNGNNVVISTNYFRNKPTDTLIRSFNKFGEWVTSKLKYYDSQGRVCNHNIAK